MLESGIWDRETGVGSRESWNAMIRPVRKQRTCFECAGNLHVLLNQKTVARAPV